MIKYKVGAYKNDICWYEFESQLSFVDCYKQAYKELFTAILNNLLPLNIEPVSIAYRKSVSIYFKNCGYEIIELVECDHEIDRINAVWKQTALFLDEIALHRKLSFGGMMYNTTGFSQLMDNLEDFSDEYKTGDK